MKIIRPANKTALTVSILALAVFIIFAGTFLIRGEREGAVGVRIQADEGLIIEGSEDGGRVIFETYSFYNPEAEDRINISGENAELTVTTPAGETYGATSEAWYYPVSIIPPAEAGTYELSVVLRSGDVYEGSFMFEEPQEVRAAFLRKEGEVSFEDFNLREFSQIIYITPGNSVFGASISKDGNIIVPEDVLEDGEYIFLAKKENIWHYAVIEYPEDI